VVQVIQGQPADVAIGRAGATATQEKDALMSDISTGYTFELAGQLMSVMLVENNGEIDIRVYTDVGLSFSGTFDPKKEFFQQGSGRVKSWAFEESLIAQASAVK
jgi:hypothetical protein